MRSNHGTGSLALAILGCSLKRNVSWYLLLLARLASWSGKAGTATVDSPPWFTSLLSQLDNLNSAQGSTFDFALASTNHVPIVLTGNSYVKLVPTIPLFI